MSSAKDRDLPVEEPMLETKKLKSVGLMTLPCGTPIFIFIQDDVAPW